MISKLIHVLFACLLFALMAFFSLSIVVELTLDNQDIVTFIEDSKKSRSGAPDLLPEIAFSAEPIALARYPRLFSPLGSRESTE